MAPRGGKTYRQHTSLKEYVKRRDNFQCVLCGGTETLIVDHIIPYLVSRDSRLSNLRTLCRPCNVRTRRPPANANPHKSMEDYWHYIEQELANTAL